MVCCEMRRHAVASIGLIHAVGIFSMYGLIYRNGYVDALKQVYNEVPFVLPGSQNPVLTRYINFFPIDELLTLGSIMFSNVLDGSTPQLSLYAFYFAGQLVPVWVTIMTQGIHQGNRGLSLAVLWGCLMQATGYGFVFPLYCITYLLRWQPEIPPIDSTIGSANVIHNIELVPVSTSLGYIIPSILMSLPLHWIRLSLPWNLIHQWLIAVWQGFPLWVCVINKLMALRMIRHWNGQPTVDPNSPRNISLLRAIRGAYDFASLCARLTHTITLTVIALGTFLPVSFDSKQSFTLQKVFIPPRFWSVQKAPNMAIGIHNFFQYDQYVGSAAAIVWVAALYCEKAKTKQAPARVSQIVVNIGGSLLLSGPAGIICDLMLETEEQALEF